MTRYPSIHMWFNAIWGGKPQMVQIQELPHCTPEILYAQAWPVHPETVMGLFSFRQEHVLECARRHIERTQFEGDSRYHPFDQSVLKWLANVDWSASEPIRLPQGWVGIECALLPLIEENEFRVKCLGCNRDYLPESLVRVAETHGFGSFHHILDCPKDHRLIAIETIHTV